MNPSLIVAAMTRAILLTALMLTVAVPMFAQSTEFGVSVGGGRRFVDTGDVEDGRELLDNKFTLSNSAVELYWAIELEEATRLKFKVGRLETPVAFEVPDTTTPDVDDDVLRRDLMGEVQHASAVIEYRFDEPYGSTSLFGGVGFYRQSADDDDSEIEGRSGYGFQVGVNADFPITRRYGVITEATYHWSRGPFTPRYLTLTAGLRLAF